MSGKPNDSDEPMDSRAENCLRFVWRGEIVEIVDFSPTTTILEFLREQQFSTGTKEGCNEGDCGACTIVVARPRNGRLEYRSINACIQLLGTLHGAWLITVEDLAEQPGMLHAVQSAMVEHHAAQCGFCTPGFVMSLFALSHRDDKAPLSRQIITDAIAGNLCRCTGYRPIVDAAFAACNQSEHDRFTSSEPVILEQLLKIDPAKSLITGDDKNFFASPATEDQLAEIYENHPEALLVSGATDVGLWITKQLRNFEKIIYLGRVEEFNTCRATKHGLEIGAGVTFTDAFARLAEIDPDLGELLRRIGSEQIRNSGTIGGNIANGSPIGDSPPALIVLNATLELRKGKDIREIPLENFFINYGKQDIRDGEFIRCIKIPALADNEHFRCFKIAKRFDQDISSVLGAICLKIDDGIIREARIAFGGMAGIPKRAPLTEAALTGLDLNASTDWHEQIENLEKDFDPLSDMRASREYRIRAAKGLLTKALLELGAPKTLTRLVAMRPEQQGATHG